MKRLLGWTAAALMALGTASIASALPTAGQASSERIYSSVRRELVRLPRLTVFDNLAYKVEGDTVTLYGQVRNPALKDDAASVVRSIAGVENVDNQIEVLPVSFNDERIRLREARAIYGYDGLFRYSLGTLPPIRIIVRNGNVTLAGIVDSQLDRNLAGIRANGVPGVFSVTNDLQIGDQRSGN